MRILVVAAMSLGAALSALAAENYTAKVTGGLIRGVPRAEGGAQFLGVPYAAAPVREWRWKAPQPVEPWTGERDASRPGPASLQADLGWNQSQRAHQSEDSLYLNVLTAVWPAQARRPVIVYIHGGANLGGAGWDHLLEHTTLPERGVVLVSLNYRLGVFGFLAHPELTAESPHHASGNYALMDQIAALRWVRDNIATFGGDPANVTVMGQSAGALNIGLLMVSPEARGLFRRVILESGPVASIGSFQQPALGDAEKTGRTLLEKMGRKSIAELRALPAEDVLAGAVAARVGLGAIVDGWVLPAAPTELFQSGAAKALAVIVGSNAREFGFQGDAAELRKQITAAFGELAPRAMRLYGVDEGQPMPVADPVLGSAGEQFVSDLVFRVPSEFVALWQSQAGAPVWRYQFSRTPIGKEAVGAGHSAELPYVFGEMVPNELGADYHPADKALSRAIQRYWVNFATTGDPNGDEVPKWAAYVPDRRAYVDFEETGVNAREGLRREWVDLSLERVAQLIAVRTK